MNLNIPIYDICTISKTRNEDILISRFGDYYKQHTHLHLPHKHNFYHVVFFTECAGNHTIDFESFEAKSNQIYFMIPGQVHSWSFKGNLDGYIINFSANFYQSFLLNPEYLEEFSFFSGNVKDAVINIKEGSEVEVINIFEKILTENTYSLKSNDEMIKLLMLQLFILISRQTTENKQNQPNNYNAILLKNFKKLIEENYTKLKLPKEYASLLYITPNHLNALCNDILGISAGEVIRNRIILEAKRLLTNLQLSITEIAYQLNFKDNSYFSKFFKKQVGISPDEFRKKIII